MIKFGDWVIPGVCEWYFAIEGMRNPMNSWDRSDSKSKGKNGYFDLGEADNVLATRLVVAGTEHRKFLRMLNAYVRITAPLYVLKELDAYRIGIVCNSCSSMHSMMKRDFEVDDFSHDMLDTVTIKYLENIVEELNSLRHLYLYTEDAKLKKKYWYQIIQLLPSSYMQTRNYMFSFETLMNIHKQRKGHKLDEWRVFCEEIEKIPYLGDFIKANEE